MVSSITANRKFVQVARYMILNENERKNLAPIVQEKIKNRGDIWYTMIVNPKERNFQIFINGSQRGIHDTSPEIIKAILLIVLNSMNSGQGVPDNRSIWEESIQMDLKKRILSFKGTLKTEEI